MRASGKGPPLFKTANWLNHLEFDWQSPVWRHWFSTLSATHHSLYRYDARGCGLSDWVQDGLSPERNVSDLECVVEASRSGALRATRACRREPPSPSSMRCVTQSVSVIW